MCTCNNNNNDNNDKICSVHISTLLGAQGANPEPPGQAPFSFTISVLGSFMCITQHTGHTGPTALRPIRRTKQLWLSVLLKDTSAATGHTGIQTHILATPELESNALDRSATTNTLCTHVHAHVCTMRIYTSLAAMRLYMSTGPVACLKLLLLLLGVKLDDEYHTSLEMFLSDTL